MTCCRLETITKLYKLRKKESKIKRWLELKIEGGHRSKKEIPTLLRLSTSGQGSEGVQSEVTCSTTRLGYIRTVDASENPTNNRPG